MRKEYLSPEMQVVKLSMNINILAESIPGNEGSGPADTKEYNNVDNTSTSGGNSIWDNEW